eukprot:206147-Chlamydomonas_euryale.AAC.1
MVARRMEVCYGSEAHGGGPLSRAASGAAPLHIGTAPVVARGVAPDAAPVVARGVAPGVASVVLRVVLRLVRPPGTAATVAVLARNAVHPAMQGRTDWHTQPCKD